MVQANNLHWSDSLRYHAESRSVDTEQSIKYYHLKNEELSRVKYDRPYQSGPIESCYVAAYLFNRCKFLSRVRGQELVQITDQ